MGPGVGRRVGRELGGHVGCLSGKRGHAHHNHGYESRRYQRDQANPKPALVRSTVGRIGIPLQQVKLP